MNSSGISCTEVHWGECDRSLRRNGSEAVMARAKRTKETTAGARNHCYSTKIIKAGALLGDTKTLFLHWDTSLPHHHNVSRFLEKNLFGKASRSRTEDILAIFRQRYLNEEDVTKALVVLVQKRLPPASLNRILYFHAAKADSLLHDVVTTILLPLKGQGIVDVAVTDIHRELSTWVYDGKTARKWSDATIRRVSQGMLSTLRDFGVLQGAVNKRIAPVYLPITAFAYVAFYLKQHATSGTKVLDLPDWKLFFLPSAGVERFMLEAHQCGLLEFHTAGSVVRLTFPTDSMEEYANVLAERAH